MKQGTTIAELAAELERQKDAKADLVVDTRELTMLSTPQEPGSYTEVAIGALGEYGVNQYAHGQISDRLSIPRKYYERLRAEHPALLDQNVNTLWRERPERRMLRTWDYGEQDRTVRAVLSDRYRRIDNDDVLTAVMPILGKVPDLRVESCALTERRLYLKVVAPRIEAEVKLHDVVQAGLVITNSEVGAGALSVRPLVFRLECLNGMIVGHALRKYHVGRQADADDALRVFKDDTLIADDAAFMLKLRDVVEAALSEASFAQIVAQMKETADTPPMADPVAGIERLGKRLGLSDGEQRGVLHHLALGGDLSAFGALNAVTRYAQDVEDYDRATELEELGGDMLTLSGREWAAVAA